MFPDRDPTYETDIATVLALVVSRGEREPSPAQPRRLAGLFKTLKTAGSRDMADQVQDLIWSVWCDAEDPAARDAMHDGITCMAAEHFDEALGIFDALVVSMPEWPEAWNKRATIFYILGRDRESLGDIARVLEREPRHFGAISGFGQIALRNGYIHEAVIAFEAAYDINPNLFGVKQVLTGLRRQRSGTLN